MAAVRETTRSFATSAAAQVVPDYDLTDPMDLANFFSFANIRLLRGAFIKHLAKEKLGLPRRQEAEQASCGSQTALAACCIELGWFCRLVGRKLCRVV